MTPRIPRINSLNKELDDLKTICAAHRDFLISLKKQYYFTEEIWVEWLNRISKIADEKCSSYIKS